MIITLQRSKTFNYQFLHGLVPVLLEDLARELAPLGAAVVLAVGGGQVTVEVQVETSNSVVAYVIPEML